MLWEIKEGINYCVVKNRDFVGNSMSFVLFCGGNRYGFSYLLLIYKLF